MAKKKVKERKIAIFGTTPSRMTGPVQDDSGWERWTIGPGGKDAHNWERLYEIHGTWPVDFQGYLNDLSLVEQPRQVVILPQPDQPTWEEAIANWKAQHKLGDDAIEGDWSAIRPYPRDAVLKQFLRRMWFSSSISWLIAEAIMEEPTDIGLWGIDLESGEEYISQFVGCVHLLDLAQFRGINVSLPDSSGLMRDPAPYPDRCETHLALTFEKKVQFLEQALGQKEPEYNAMNGEVHRLEGRVLALRELEADAKLIQETEAALIAANQQIAGIAANLHELRGELNATRFYQRMYVWSMRDAI